MFNVFNFYKRFLNIFTDSHFYKSPTIKSVEIDYNDYVYNLSIEGDETYIADGVVVHNCRSVRVPNLKKELASVKQSEDNQDFDGWLRSQSASFQDEYFSQFANGAEKAKLFRQGGLDIQFFRDETGKEYSIDQLKALYPSMLDPLDLTPPFGG